MGDMLVDDGDCGGLDSPTGLLEGVGEPVGEHKPQSRAEQWNANIDQVLGHARVNGSVKKLPRRLSNWLGRQKSRKDMSNQERDRLEALKDYGYDWKGKDEWEASFAQLVEYVHEIGRKRVSNQHKKLSEWVSRQRSNEKEGRLSEERKQRLLDLGFSLRKNKPYAKKQNTPPTK